MAVTEEIAAFSKESDRHEAVHQAAIPRRDAAMYDETWWSSRVVSLANMMAVQVQNEEVGRQVQRTQPRPSAGGKDDVGEDEEDEDIAEDIEEAQKYEERMTRMVISCHRRRESTKKATSVPLRRVCTKISNGGDHFSEPAVTEDTFHYRDQRLDFGGMTLEDTPATRNTLDESAGAAST